MQRLKTEDRNIIERSGQEATYEKLTDKKLRVNQRKAAGVKYLQRSHIRTR